MRLVLIAGLSAIAVLAQVDDVAIRPLGVGVDRDPERAIGADAGAAGADFGGR